MCSLLKFFSDVASRFFIRISSRLKVYIWTCITTVPFLGLLRFFSDEAYAEKSFSELSLMLWTGRLCTFLSTISFSKYWAQNLPKAVPFTNTIGTEVRFLQSFITKVISCVHNRLEFSPSFSRPCVYLTAGIVLYSSWSSISHRFDAFCLPPINFSSHLSKRLLVSVNSLLVTIKWKCFWNLIFVGYLYINRSTSSNTSFFDSTLRHCR